MTDPAPTIQQMPRAERDTALCWTAAKGWNPGIAVGSALAGALAQARRVTSNRGGSAPPRAKVAKAHALPAVPW